MKNRLPLLAVIAAALLVSAAAVASQYTAKNRFIQPSGSGTDNALVLDGSVQSQDVRLPTTATFTVGTISGDNIDTQIVFKDGNGTAIAYPYETYVWISDATTGAAYTTTAMSAVLSAVTNGSVESVTSGKSANVITSAAGLLGVRATQSSNTGPTSYLCVRLALGATSCSGALTYH